MNDNRFFKLPVQFHVNQLQSELELCEKEQWKAHFNQADYNGDWTSIALRSASGRADDIYSHPLNIHFTNTPLLERCTYLRSVIDWFDCEKETVRLLSLAPGSEIREHTDPQTGYEYGIFRIHVPILTDAEVEFCVDGTNLDMQAGDCWYANFHLPHSVANRSQRRRVHLVIDARRNAWSDRIFEKAGYDFALEERQKDHDKETKQRMIDELALMDTPAARDLIARLRQEIEA
jgi:quercetin dioxygenase-like cupin family protein